MPHLTCCIAVLVLILLFSAEASALHISSQNKSCTLPAPHGSTVWIASSAVAIGSNFLVSLDFGLENSAWNTASWLMLLDPSTCEVLSQLELSFSCFSSLSNTRIPTLATLYCLSRNSSVGLLSSISVTNSIISLANSTSVSSANGSVAQLASSYSLLDAAGRIYFAVMLGIFPNARSALAQYDAVDNTFTVLTNCTALKEGNLLTVSPSGAEFGLLNVAGSRQCAIFSSATGLPLANLSVSGNSSVTKIINDAPGGASLVLGIPSSPSTSAITTVAVINWSNYQAGKPVSISGMIPIQGNQAPPGGFYSTWLGTWLFVQGTNNQLLHPSLAIIDTSLSTPTVSTQQPLKCPFGTMAATPQYLAVFPSILTAFGQPLVVTLYPLS